MEFVRATRLYFFCFLNQIRLKNVVSLNAHAAHNLDTIDAFIHLRDFAEEED